MVSTERPVRGRRSGSPASSMAGREPEQVFGACRCRATSTLGAVLDQALRTAARARVARFQSCTLPINFNAPGRAALARARRSMPPKPPRICFCGPRRGRGCEGQAGVEDGLDGRRCFEKCFGDPLARCASCASTRTEERAALPRKQQPCLERARAPAPALARGPSLMRFQKSSSAGASSACRRPTSEWPFEILSSRSASRGLRRARSGWLHTGVAKGRGRRRVFAPARWAISASAAIVADREGGVWPAFSIQTSFRFCPAAPRRRPGRAGLRSTVSTFRPPVACPNPLSQLRSAQ